MFAIAAEDAELREDEEPTTLIETGRALIAKYMAEAAPSIQPKAVELHVEGVIAGTRMQGIVDLLDVEGRIIDCKTASRGPVGITAEYRLQLTTYSIITPGASARADWTPSRKLKRCNSSSKVAKSVQKSAGMRKRFIRWCRNPCATGSTHRVVAARFARVGTAVTGGNASWNSVDV